MSISIYSKGDYEEMPVVLAQKNKANLYLNGHGVSRYAKSVKNTQDTGNITINLVFLIQIQNLICVVKRSKC